MKYKINYPYYGITFDGLYFVITAPEYVIVQQHNGTFGFGLSAFISRGKVIKLFRFSKEISRQQFDDHAKQSMQNFINTIPGASEVLAPTGNMKLLKGGKNDLEKML